MTAEESPKDPPSRGVKRQIPDRLTGVFGAGRDEPAARRQERAPHDPENVQNLEQDRS